MFIIKGAYNHQRHRMQKRGFFKSHIWRPLSGWQEILMAIFVEKEALSNGKVKTNYN
jgi:hypothetical protein